MMCVLEYMHVYKGYRVLEYDSSSMKTADSAVLAYNILYIPTHGHTKTKRTTKLAGVWQLTWVPLTNSWSRSRAAAATEGSVGPTEAR